MQDEETIRRRAYEIWVAESRPEGREAEHWERARRELAAEAAAMAHAPAAAIEDAADAVAAPQGPAPAAEAAPDVADQPAAAPKRRRAKKS